ncbi:DHA2 family efflux MFS transporter permease subunit [Psychrobacillus sp. FSL K6-2684]|uniref:DHA2 family efflux MFS transporter permease subunit n=1 Tax=Psychrobacillus faecigallinarum TaxID=2762235 RepID=A0ABR8RCE1_9BACI|nr:MULTISPECIES: DHA2 family efflux MFS transporter permease subunit [Psychrobacillus]MBD7945461.1 DHA2 family efflux MFS transporter permease subunit [Psychrobacillus faecigallinarum]QEY21684.1 DHA2 family efflux MFS transporter permease subunit [Psychrobacillus sp. AK 1817]QGM32138.1 DHA2 family efflux MFS transporter permease subunit [Bacillus sp. N3536]
MQNEISNSTKKLLIIIMITGTFFSTLNQTLLNVAFSDLMVVFDVSTATIQWLATGFMLVNGVLVPITAYLMKRFSTRQLFISSMLFLLIGSIISACANNFGILLTGRMVQAVGAGIIIPLMMTVIVYLYPAEKRGAMMGKIGFAIIFAPAIAPTLAGFILEYLSWRWLFIIMVPFAALIIILASKYLINVAETSKVKLDIISVIYSTVGFGLVLFGFSSAGSKGWDDLIVITSIIAGLLVTILFCHRQIKATEPLLNLNVFRFKIFTMTSIVNIAITILMYADLILLPIYLQDGRGFTALEAGLLLLPGAIINAMLSPVTGKLFDKFGAKPLFILGTGLIALSMLAVIDLSPETTTAYILVRTILLRIGLAFITMPLNTAALNSLPKELASHGSAINNTVRQLAGAIGTAVIMTIYSIQLLNVSLESTTGYIGATSNTYLYMFVISMIAFIITWFTPKKTN